MPTKKTVDKDLRNEFIGKHKQIATWLKKPGKKYGVDLKSVLLPTDNAETVNKILRQISDLKHLGVNPKDFAQELEREKTKRANPFLFELKEKAPLIASTFRASRQEKEQKRAKFGKLFQSVLQKQGKPFTLHKSFTGKLQKDMFASQAVWQQYRATPLQDYKYNYDPNQIPPYDLLEVPTLMNNEDWAKAYFTSMERQMIRRMRARLSQGPYKVFAKAKVQVRRDATEDENRELAAMYNESQSFDEGSDEYNEIIRWMK